MGAEAEKALCVYGRHVNTVEQEIRRDSSNLSLSFSFYTPFSPLPPENPSHIQRRLSVIA